MDPRDRQRRYGDWYEEFDERRMVFVFYSTDEEGERVPTGKLDEDGEPLFEMQLVPAHYEVCGLCSGRGSHVNPSIDYNGISSHKFAEDPDFAEDYFNGCYDVPCYRCTGRRVEPVVNWDQLAPEQRKLVTDAMDSHSEYVAECSSECLYEW